MLSVYVELMRQIIDKNWLLHNILLAFHMEVCRAKRDKSRFSMGLKVLHYIHAVHNK